MPVSSQSGLSDNAAGAVAYITFVPAVVFLFLPPYNTNPYVRFHAWQSIFLNCAAMLVNILLSMLAVVTLITGPFAFYSLVRIVWVLWMLLWVVCVVQAVNGKLFKLPIIGNIAEKLAAR
jgi:uncharacterized membrane protein